MNRLEGYCYWQQPPRPDCSFNWSRLCQPPLTQLAFPWQAVQWFADGCSLTLLFLGTVGIPRTWDLRGYTADGLALLTGRTRAYGYRYTEVFLSQIAHADGAERFTLLHDEQGHPLFVTTHRGDQHLTAGVPPFLARYEQHSGNSQATRMIVDREGMATEFLARLHAEGRSVVTILQTNQYRYLSSFSDVGAFVPMNRDAHWQVIREVAPARSSSPRPRGSPVPFALGKRPAP